MRFHAVKVDRLRESGGGQVKMQTSSGHMARVARRLIAVFALLPLAGSTLAADAAPAISGRSAAGADWIIERPAAWNGTLLLYARGYAAVRRPGPPESAPRELREWLLAQGYALAASSYSAEGWALAEAPRDQLDVLDAFVARYGKPRRTIGWGSSMGGLVTVALAEKHSDRIDGALPACGSVSGSVGMLNTALDGAWVFRELAANDPQLRITGLEDDRANSARAMAALDAAWSTPQGRARVMLAAALAQLPEWSDAAAPEPPADELEARAAQVRRTFVMGTFVPRVDHERRAGGVNSWNTGVDYARQLRASGRESSVRRYYAAANLDLAADLARLAAAPRIAADARAVAYMRANYVPTGKLGVPVLTLQTVGDGLTVPATHGSLQQFAREAGRAAMLQQLWVKGAGHCTFTAGEWLAALRALELRLDKGKWNTDIAAVARLGEGVPGPVRFVKHEEPALLRHCGARAGSCPGEPRAP